MRSDKEFIQGDISFLVEGNVCRFLDGRRTTGFIEKCFFDEGMFRWRITNYEDKCKYWDLPAEESKRFQFEKGSKKMSKEDLKWFEDSLKKYQKFLNIAGSIRERDETEEEINKTKDKAIQWLEKQSLFFKNTNKIDFSSCEGSTLLAQDLKNYMKSIGLYEEERKTAETMVLNPNSGEWIKGMNIVIAELGLVPYQDKVPRTNAIFEGIGNKKNRRRYIINRLAFIRAYFYLLNIFEVVLYKGMSNENQWRVVPRTYLPCTFNLEVAEAFSDFRRNSKYKISYLVKMTIPVEKIFMTYFETEEMNRQYKEAEALVLYDDVIQI